MMPREVLMLPMEQNDANADTVGEYLQTLLRKVWEEDEGFNGKRPFGNSGWAYDLYRAVLRGGASTGTIDSQGDVSEKGDADQVIFDAIDAMFPAPWTVEETDKVKAASLRAMAADFQEKADQLDPPQ